MWSIRKSRHVCLAEDCKLVFKSFKSMSDHINEQHNGRVTCPYKNCGTPMRPSGIRSHFIRVHEYDNPKISCKLCGKLVDPKSVRSHQKSKSCVSIKENSSQQNFQDFDDEEFEAVVEENRPVIRRSYDQESRPDKISKWPIADEIILSDSD